jgi:hypothetical protein
VFHAGEKREMRTECWTVGLKRRYHMGDLDVDGSKGKVAPVLN